MKFKLGSGRRLLILISTATLFLLGPLFAMASGPHDVRPGMTIEEATRVAINCIQAASRMQTKDIRLQDTLVFVGINDEMRLDALRRHIVRNPNIGVGSVTRSFNGRLLHYLILNRSLLEIDTSASVAKLAQQIVKNAGLARLTYARASEIVGKCRANTDNLSTDIEVYANLGSNTETFIKCLANDNQKDPNKPPTVTGIPTAGVSDPTGREYRYELDRKELTRWIDVDRVSYRELIRRIADTAEPRGLSRAYGGS